MPIQQLHKTLSANRTDLRNIISLLSGSFIAQIINFSITPIITRLYTPEVLGQLALFTAIVLVLTKISSLSYERAILLPKKHYDCVTLLFLACILSLVTFPVSSLTIYLVGLMFYISTGNDLPSWTWLIPFSIILFSLENIFRFWRIRNKNFDSLAMAKISNSLCVAGIKISFGFYFGSLLGCLIAGYLLGGAVATIVLLKKPSPFSINHELKKVNKESLYRMARTYRQFPYFSTWNMFLNQSSQYIAIFVLSIFYPLIIVGFYSTASSILSQPVLLFSESIRNVFFQNAAVNYNSGKPLLPTYKKVLLSLVMTGMPPFVTLAIWGEPIFEFVLGSKWGTAGLYCQVLTPWFFVLYINSAVSIIYEVYGKQKIRLIINLLMFFMRFLTLAAGSLIFNDALIVISIFVFINIFFEVINIIITYKITKNNDQHIGSSAVP